MQYGGFLVVLALLFAFGCVTPPDGNNTQTGDNVCVSECEAGESRCVGTGDNRFEVCVESDDCSAWEQQAVCTPDQTCSPSNGCECNSSCELGEMNCSDADNPVRCTTVDGCTIEVSPCVVSCDECNGRACEPACGNQACLVCLEDIPLN